MKADSRRYQKQSEDMISELATFSVTYTVNMAGTILSAHFHWDVLVFVKVDSSVVYSKQLPAVQRHTFISNN